ncbi:Rid family detoxifying hydrolase [Arcanobacterium sp. S3PF19]|uniref:Rid family detoxifying hydrolase n=1 Tax=Arcanobacterium sp. S3PF19 TaxID=1219585 RepID=UPI0005100D46|nr:Rid family detoxifying hydrolase [Arcanobacterium sp. S3PF19]KGF06068.1 endoribonuclease L-PSP [Arcanobacterium sp. S3PF19]
MKLQRIDIPAAVGPYSAAVKAGNVVSVSGQLPLNPATGTLVSQDVREQTKRSLELVNSVLAQYGLSLANVFKTTVLLADINDFAAMNEVYGECFADVEQYPARSAFQVGALPMGARVEIEALAYCPA